jgi:YARHG domain
VRLFNLGALFAVVISLTTAKAYVEPAKQLVPSMTEIQWEGWNIKINGLFFTNLIDQGYTKKTAQNDSVFVYLDLTVKNNNNRGVNFIPQNCLKIIIGDDSFDAEDCGEETSNDLENIQPTLTRKRACYFELPTALVQDSFALRLSGFLSDQYDIQVRIEQPKPKSRGKISLHSDTSTEVNRQLCNLESKMAWSINPRPEEGANEDFDAMVQTAKTLGIPLTKDISEGVRKDGQVTYEYYVDYTYYGRTWYQKEVQATSSGLIVTIQPTPTPTPEQEALPVFESQASASPSPLNNSTPSPQGQASEFPSSRALDGEQYPQTRLRVLTAEDVKGLNIAQLRYAINEVYARYGASFPNTPDIQRHFERFPWYHPNPSLTYEAIDQIMSDVERQNVKFLALCRELKRGR